MRHAQTKRVYGTGPKSCPGWPHIKEPSDHAWAIFDWLRRSPAVAYGGGESAWESTATWMSLAAGLRRVDVDLGERGAAGWMCSQAAPYEDAASNTASGYHTELTRLLYTYCAFENALYALKPDWNGYQADKLARKLLRARGDDLIAHYGCRLDHLGEHVRNSPLLARDESLAAVFEKWSGESNNILGMQVGLKLRHWFAHGALDLPQPRPTDASWVPGGRVELCVAKAANTCLLMTLQLLIRSGVEAGLPLDDDSYEFAEGLWVNSPEGGDLVHEMSGLQFLLNLHLLEGEPEI